MPIEIHDRKTPISPAEARAILQSETDRFGTFFNLDRVLYHEARYMREAQKRYPELRAIAGDPYLVCTAKSTIRDTLIMRLGVPKHKLYNKDGSPSVDKATVQSLLADESIGDDARRFLQLYSEISAASYMASYLKQYRILPISKVEDMDNQRMVVAHPTWSLLSTSRISASTPSLQNVNREICDIYTAPKGWQLVFSDSGQIEPRITYSAYIRDDLIVNLITLYDDAYIGLLHYILMSEEEERAARNDFSSVKMLEVTEDVSQKRKCLKVLGLAGNYGSHNLGAVDPELGPLYARKIVNHPARREMEARVTAAVRNGQDCFYGYFGTPVQPDSTQKYERGGSGWMNHLVRCGINNPNQTTASELMCFSIYNAKKVLGPKDHIGAYKHDEGMFYVREDHVDDMAPKLRECMAYNVDGWIPIGSDLVIGRKRSIHTEGIF